MRVMVLSIVDQAGGDLGPPTQEAIEAFAAMDRFIEELVEAGVMVAGAGLWPAAKSKRIVSERGRRTVVDGPFAESKEVVAGFSIWQVSDMDEAVAWAQRAPGAAEGRTVMELRPFLEPEDLAGFVSAEDLAAPRDGERGRLGVA